MFTSNFNFSFNRYFILFLFLPLIIYLGQFLIIDEEQLISFSLLILFFLILFFSSISNFVIFQLNSRIFLFSESLRRLEFLNFLILHNYFLSLKLVIFSMVLPQVLNFFLLRYKFFRKFSNLALRTFFLIYNFHEYLYISLLLQWCTYSFFQKLFDLSIISLLNTSSFCGLPNIFLPILSCFPLKKFSSKFDILPIYQTTTLNYYTTFYEFINFINFLFFTNTFFLAQKNQEFNLDDFEELFFFYCPTNILNLFVKFIWDSTFFKNWISLGFLSFFSDLFSYGEFEPLRFLHQQNFLGLSLSNFASEIPFISINHSSLDFFIFREWYITLLNFQKVPSDFFFFSCSFFQYNQIFFLLTFILSFFFKISSLISFFSISDSCLYISDQISRQDYIHLLLLNESSDDIWESFLANWTSHCEFLNSSHTVFNYEVWRFSSWPLAFRFSLLASDLE